MFEMCCYKKLLMFCSALYQPRLFSKNFFDSCELVADSGSGFVHVCFDLQMYNKSKNLMLKKRENCHRLLTKYHCLLQKGSLKASDSCLFSTRASVVTMPVRKDGMEAAIASFSPIMKRSLFTLMRIFCCSAQEI